MAHNRQLPPWRLHFDPFLDHFWAILLSLGIKIKNNKAFKHNIKLEISCFSHFYIYNDWLHHEYDTSVNVTTSNNELTRCKSVPQACNYEKDFRE